ncbi:hypothetical protein AAC387_Pa11g0233 [Persea americana]
MMFYTLTSSWAPALRPHDNRISARNSPCNNLLRLFLKSVVNGGRSQPTLMQANFQIVFLKTVAQAFTSSFSCPKAQYSGMLHLSNNEDESSGTCFHLQPQPCALGSLMELQTNSKSVPVGRNEDHLFQDLDWGLHNIAGRDSCSTKDNAKKDHKEMRRRRKIGLANKGKTPWNKGRKHSAETRERIKQRTIEALRDPKVRKKMSEYPRVHSDQSKARISFALRRVWGKRLKWKRCQEKCYLQWALSIAEEARKGGCDQHELEWDSYEKIKAEIVREQLQWAEEKAKAKEMIKVKAERAAKVKAEKARLARERKEKKQKAKARAESMQEVRRKSEEERETKAIFKRLKLKVRFTKIRDESVAHLIASQSDTVNGIEPAIEKWDLEFIKREKIRREVSLADQIQAVKKNKTDLIPMGGLKTLSYDSTPEGKAGDG